MKTTIVLSLLGITLFASSAQAQIGDSYIDARTVLYRGLEDFTEEDYDGAIRNFSKIQEGDSLYELGLYETTLAQISDKRYEEALKNAEKGLRISKKYRKDFLLQKGNTLELMGQVDSALVIYDIGIREFPNIYNWYYEKGVTYIKKKDWEKGMENLQKSLMINPNHRGSHVKLGVLAASSERPALALLGLQYLLLQNATEGDVALSIVALMQEISGGTYEPEEGHTAPASVFKSVDELSELDDLLRSKVALSDKFKPSLKLDFHITKQMQLLIEQLPSDLESDNAIFQRYISFFQQVKKDKEYPQMMLYGLSNINDPKIQKQVRKNKTKILAFQEKFLTSSRENYQKIELVIDGKKETMMCHYSEGKLIAAGDLTAENIREGRWYFFHDNGYLSAKGSFRDDKKTGEWYYYYSDGVLSSKETYTDGMLNGPYVDYVENGEKKVEATYDKGKLVNELVFYWPNGVIKERIPLKNSERSGPYVSYHPNGRKASEYTMVKGEGVGAYTSWHKNGKVNSKGDLKNDLFVGTFTSYYDNGQVYASGNYVNGDRDGSFTYYHRNGVKYQEGTWKKGKRTGAWKEWYDNGVLSSESTYIDDKWDGDHKEYDPEGKLIYIHNYKKGNLSSVTIYDKSGKEIDKRREQNGSIHMVYYDFQRLKVSEGMLENGEREGTWKFFYPSGVLKAKENYSKGVVQETAEHYFENGKIKSQHYYENGERQGFGRYYYQNGVVQSSGYYKDDIRYGPWKFFDVGNNLTSTEFYYNGEIHGLDRSYYPNGQTSSEVSYKCYWFENSNFFDTSGYQFDTTNLVSGDGFYQRKANNGAVVYQIPYKDHYRHGKGEGFFLNGKKSFEANYEFDEAQGKATWYHASGKKETEGYYLNDERDSVWTWYFPNGKTEQTATYKDGELHGVRKYFNDQGKLISERYYEDGKRNGVTTTYNDNGEALFRLYHWNDRLTHYSYQGKDGKWLDSIAIPPSGEVTITTYFPSGAKASVFGVKDGYYQGEDIQYFANGKKYKQYNQVCNETEGTWQQWYSNGNLQEEENYKSGELHGKCMYYHRNGKVALEVTYFYGEKQGAEKVYDENGKLLLTTNYYYGQEIK